MFLLRSVCRTINARPLVNVFPRTVLLPVLIRPYARYQITGFSRQYSTPIGKINKPTYQLTFTCKSCNDRSSHLVSKQAYHNGTVLVQCPSCKNRHLIADHLNVFGEGKKSLEDILLEKGDGKKITHNTIDLSKLGDIEWEGPNSEQIEPNQVEPEHK